MPPVVVGAAIIAAASVGTGVYQSKQEKKSQRSLLQNQENAARAAEEKAEAAESLATAEADKQVKSRRRAITQTILTSPLGAALGGSTEKSTLLGGG